MNRLLSTLLYVGVIVVSLGIGKVALSSEVQQPAPPIVYMLNDGTKCVVWNGELECDFKQGDLVRELNYLRGYIASLQSELTRRKWYES